MIERALRVSFANGRGIPPSVSSSAYAPDAAAAILEEEALASALRPQPATEARRRLDHNDARTRKRATEVVGGDEPADATANHADPHFFHTPKTQQLMHNMESSGDLLHTRPNTLDRTGGAWTVLENAGNFPIATFPLNPVTRWAARQTHCE